MTRIIFPPRPKGTIPPKDLNYYEKLGMWCVQPKYQGARCLIHITPEQEVNFYSRHGRPFLNYVPPKFLKSEILKLRGVEPGIEYWLDGEILIKTTAQDTKNKIILFDILHYKRYLFLKPSQVERLKILYEICGEPKELDPWRKMGYVVSENILVAPVFYSNFAEHFNENNCDEVEGLVLRKKDSTIENYGEKEQDVNWLIRCRKPNKNCNF